MKKYLLTTAFSLLIFYGIGSAQDAGDMRLKQIAVTYLQIKDALVKDNTVQAQSAAQAFIKNLNGISYQTISEGNVNALLKDAGAISNSTDISMQRKIFKNLSDNITILAKKHDLSNDALFIQYCPMKKASWISDKKEIKNPYYGSSMLTCGSLKETID